MCECCGSWTRCEQRRRQQGSKSSEFTIAIIILLPLSACRLNILDTDLGYRDYTSCPSYYLIVYLYICISTLHFICGFVAQRFFLYAITRNILQQTLCIVACIRFQFCSNFQHYIAQIISQYMQQGPKMDSV